MISGKTRIYGIAGFPVEHTFSPGMHNAAFRFLKIDACYVPFSVHPDHLRDAVRALVPLGLQGMNITVPHKVSILRHIDELSEDARLIGAVNTLEIKKGMLVGHNTDGRGFLRSLREEARFDPRGRTFLCIGAGGAARAVSFSLALAGAARILFLNRDIRKANRLARDLQAGTGTEARALLEGELSDAAASAHCIINTTPLGLRKEDPLPLSPALIGKNHLACDLVYNPRVTPFLRAAAGRKARTLSGLGMLLYQGVIAFEIWTGRKAPVSVMKRALLRQVAQR